MNDNKAVAPTGFFDPIGLSSEISEPELKKWRESELKHGRTAMLGALGIIAGESIEKNTPLFGDKIVGPAIYQFQVSFYQFILLLWSLVVVAVAAVSGDEYLLTCDEFSLSDGNSFIG